MDESGARAVVRIFAILSWVMAALGLLSGLVILFYVIFAGNMIAAVGATLMSAQLFVGIFLAYGVYSILVGILDIFVGLGLWRYQNWARVTLMVFTWIYGVLFALAVLFMFASGDAAGIVGGVFYLIAAGLCALIIWLFQFQPVVKALFKGS